MNKTEYMNILQHEMQDLPSDVQARLRQGVEDKFSAGASQMKSEAEICEKLAHPRVLAAEARASTRFQHLKSNFSLGNLFGLMIALIGLMVFNLFMFIPAMVYSIFVFASYIASLAVWVAGVCLLAASMSGVPEVKFNAGHHWHTHGHRSFEHQHHGLQDVRVDIDEHGITIDKQKIEDVLDKVTSSDTSSMHADREVSTVTIKNQMQGRHFFLGALLLGLGTGLLLLCLMLTRLTLIGLKKYLLWNVSILRLPMAA